MFKFFINKFNLHSNTWQVIKASLDPSSGDFEKAQTQAQKKSAYTMNYSQSGASRKNIVKYNKQLMGIVAEIACEKFISLVLERRKLSSNWRVFRYDDIRTDDFKILKNQVLNT